MFVLFNYLKSILLVNNVFWSGEHVRVVSGLKALLFHFIPDRVSSSMQPGNAPLLCLWGNEKHTVCISNLQLSILVISDQH